MPTNYKDAKEATLKSPNIAEGCLFGVVTNFTRFIDATWHFSRNKFGK